MFRGTLHLFFIAVCLNRILISAEETTTTNATEPEKNTTITLEAKPFFIKPEATKTTTEGTANIPKPDNEATTIAPVKTASAIAPRNKTSESDENTYKKTRSIIDLTTVKPKVTTATTAVSNTNEKATLEKDKEGPIVDDIVEDILDKPNWKFRGDDSAKNTSRISSSETVIKSEPSYLGKLTGKLIIPTLKARQSLSKAFSKQNQGLRDFGSGTYEAAAGAFNFVKDATSAVISG